jgi:hypothetical protein
MAVYIQDTSEQPTAKYQSSKSKIYLLAQKLDQNLKDRMYPSFEHFDIGLTHQANF